MIETKHSLDFCKLVMEVTTFPYISLLSHCFLEGRRDCLISCMFTEFHCINTSLKHAVNLALYLLTCLSLSLSNWFIFLIIFSQCPTLESIVLLTDFLPFLLSQATRPHQYPFLKAKYFCYVKGSRVTWFFGGKMCSPDRQRALISYTRTKWCKIIT